MSILDVTALRRHATLGAPAVLAVILIAGCGSTSTTTTKTGTEAATTKTTATTSPSTTTASAPTLSEKGSGHASGDFAIAQATATVDNPSKIELRVKAKPAGKGSISWNMVCTQKNLGAGSKSGQEDRSLPTTWNLPLPAAASELHDCIVSANVQLKESGEATIAIYG